MSSVSLPSRRSRRFSSLALGVIVAAVLSGCGVAGTDLRPGAAAVVGDRTVSSSEVDDLTVAACAAFGDQLAQGGTAVPLSYLRSTIVQDLALVEAVRQLGEEHGVAPGESYQRELSSVRGTVGDLPDDQVRAVEILQTSETLVSDVLGQVGAKLAADAATSDGADAVSGATPGPASDEALRIGGTALQKWLKAHDVDIDPTFGIALTAQGVIQADTSVSFAVSDLAVAGTAKEPDSTTTMKLPPSQRCGSASGS